MAIYLPSRNKIVYCIPKCGSHYLWEVCKRIDSRATRVIVNGITAMHPTATQVWLRSAFIIRHKPQGIVFTRPHDQWLESFWRFQQSVGWKYWEPETVHPTRCLRACRHNDIDQFKKKCELMFPWFVEKLFSSYQHSSVKIACLNAVEKELRSFLGVQSLPIIPESKWNKSQ